MWGNTAPTGRLEQLWTLAQIEAAYATQRKVRYVKSPVMSNINRQTQPFEPRRSIRCSLLQLKGWTLHQERWLGFTSPCVCPFLQLVLQMHNLGAFSCFLVADFLFYCVAFKRPDDVSVLYLEGFLFFWSRTAPNPPWLSASLQHLFEPLNKVMKLSESNRWMLIYSWWTFGVSTIWYEHCS